MHVAASGLWRKKDNGLSKLFQKIENKVSYRFFSSGNCFYVVLVKGEVQPWNYPAATTGGGGQASEEAALPLSSSDKETDRKCDEKTNDEIK